MPIHSQEASVMTHHMRSPFRLFIVLALVAPLCAACASKFEVHNFGAGHLWVGDQIDVQRECATRGAQYSRGERILGCTDFTRRVVISTPDPKIIAHEMCHWSLWTDSHEACPLPKP